MDMKNFMVSSMMKPNDNALALWTTALRCNQMSTEYTLKNIFVEEMPDYIFHRMQSY